MQIDREAVQRVIGLLGESEAGEIEVRDGEMRVRVRRSAIMAGAGALAAADGGVGAAGGDGAQGARVGDEPTLEYVTAGLVGLFHHGRAPDDEPMVSVGDSVTEGQVIGTIEALRKLTDVIAPTDGVIAQVLVDDGEPVQYGDRLFAIEV